MHCPSCNAALSEADPACRTCGRPAGLLDAPRPLRSLAGPAIGSYVGVVVSLAGLLVLTLSPALEIAVVQSDAEFNYGVLVGAAGVLALAGKATGDLLRRFPISDAYNKLIDSPIADMKNVGPRGGGSITAAQFIGRFVDSGVKWAHLDIAGMVWADKPGATHDKGATGYGVRLLDRLVADNFEG